MKMLRWDWQKTRSHSSWQVMKRNSDEGLLGHLLHLFPLVQTLDIHPFLADDTALLLLLQTDGEPDRHLDGQTGAERTHWTRDQVNYVGVEIRYNTDQLFLAEEFNLARIHASFRASNRSFLDTRVFRTVSQRFSTHSERYSNRLITNSNVLRLTPADSGNLAHMPTQADRHGKSKKAGTRVVVAVAIFSRHLLRFELSIAPVNYAHSLSNRDKKFILQW